MPLEFTGIDCPAGQATPLAVGKTKILVRCRTKGVGRIVKASSAPTSAPEMHYFTLVNKELSFSLDTAVNLYLWPMSGAFTVEVATE